ncbi:MAG: DUF1049 domain-containing protein [Sneathiella sp.]|nr:DUF1049 domain-containing protein [Sneathiella sp.]
MKIISWVFMAILALAIVTLSIGNKGPVTFSLYPLPFVIEVPLFALILGGGFLGILLGSIRTWMSDGKARRENRASKQEVLRLKGEVARLEKERATSNDDVANGSDQLLKITETKHSSTG